MARGLEACGVDVEEEPEVSDRARDGPGGVPGGATVASQRDHRIAMSLPGAWALRRGTDRRRRPGMIATSFPGFVALMAASARELGG